MKLRFILILLAAGPLSQATELRSFRDQIVSFTDAEPACETQLGAESALIVTPGLAFDKADVDKAMHLLENYSLHQVTLRLLNDDFTREPARSIEVFGDESAHELEPEPERGLRSIDPETAGIPSLAIVRHDWDDDREGPLVKDLSIRLLANLSTFFRAVARTKLEQMGPGYKVIRSLMMLRVTSDHVGHAVNTNSFWGDRKTGLHTHGHDNENVLEFVYAIKGLGPRLLLNDERLVEAQEGQAILFGGKTPHGSPYSDELRLIAVGHVAVGRSP